MRRSSSVGALLVLATLGLAVAAGGSGATTPTTQVKGSVTWVVEPVSFQVGG